MKSLKRVLVTIIAFTFVFSMGMATVKAIPATDLKTLKVYSVDTAGNKKQIKFAFNPTTYQYDLVVKSNVPKIEVIPTTNDATSTAVVDKEALNTRMDTGMNTTTVTVTSSTGAKQVYTLKTKKLTPAEDATYKDDDGKKTKKTKKSAKIDIDGKEYKITSFSKKDIPRGFEKTTAKYKGKSYDAIKGKEKDLTAFYLTGDDGEKFFIFDKETDKFYPMNNVKVKSRMYTIVEPEKEDDILKNYDKKEIKIDGKKVNAWILDEEKGMFFVYAMNWDGDTSLYTYDDQEKCMQRYLIDNDVNAQIDAANQAYDNMKTKRNALVKKYNIFRYIIIGMAVIIIILLFILIHKRLNRKEKMIKEDKENYPNISGDGDDEEEEQTPEEKEEQEELAKEVNAALDEDDIDNDKPISESEEIEPVEEDVEEEIEPVEEDIEEIETPEEDNAKKNEEKETHARKRSFGRKKSPMGYGDEPTFGSDKESNEGFYGGEVKKENEVLVDLSNDETPDLADPIEDLQDDSIPKDTQEIDLESINEPEDIRSTLKSMLESVDDDDDDDDDFEFIDID